jgi:hypothetical protein
MQKSSSINKIKKRIGRTSEKGEKKKKRKEKNRESKKINLGD